MTSSSVRPYLASFAGSASDLELLLEAAPGVDLGDPRHAPEPRPDDPVLERPQLGQVVVGVLAREEVVVDLAQARGDRPHRRAGRCPRAAATSPRRSLICWRAK